MPALLGMCPESAFFHDMPEPLTPAVLLASPWAIDSCPMLSTREARGFWERTSLCLGMWGGWGRSFVVLEATECSYTLHPRLIRNISNKCIVLIGIVLWRGLGQQELDLRLPSPTFSLFSPCFLLLGR